MNHRTISSKTSVILITMITICLHIKSVHSDGLEIVMHPTEDLTTNEGNSSPIDISIDENLLYKNHDSIHAKVILMKFPILKESYDLDIGRIILKSRMLVCQEELDGSQEVEVILVRREWDLDGLERGTPILYGKTIDRIKPMTHERGKWVEWDLSKLLGSVQDLDLLRNNGLLIRFSNPSRMVYSLCEFYSSESESPPVLVFEIKNESERHRLFIPMVSQKQLMDSE